MTAMAIRHRFLSLRSRRKPDHPARILIAHQLLLGDAFMLTPLLAKLRHRYPAAEIVLACPWAQAPLYASRPYGVLAWPYDARGRNSIENLLTQAAARGGFDLALIPGENRYAWFAAACEARWIVALAGGAAYKNWPLDEIRPWPPQLEPLPDVFASLIDGGAPPAYSTQDWAAPAHQPFTQPATPYCVLHVGASNPNKLWPPAHWLRLATELHERGYHIIWSAGRHETALVNACDPSGRFTSMAGQLDLAQMWQLIANAALLVAPDTGMAHLGRLVATPTIAIFGPGLTRLVGGDFWRNQPFQVVVLDDMIARYQLTLFKRSLPWLHDHEAARLAGAIYGRGFQPVRDAALHFLSR